MSEKYSKLWTKPFYYVLGPLPPYKQQFAALGVKYFPYRWFGIRYAPVVVIDEFVSQVVQKMLDAGVSIIDPLPQETEEQALAHFWTDRLHEFALITTRPGSRITHDIYHFDPPEFLTIPIALTTYQLVVNRMLLAGATVLSEIPETPKA